MAKRPTASGSTCDEHSLARQVLEIEAAAVLALVNRLDHRFETAVNILHTCLGRVIVTGMGKSGIISRKIAATLASTGTPAFFLHPAEAVHGDLGVVQGEDVIVALSYSGETNELLRLLEMVRRVGARIICLTGAPDSSLAQAADVTLDCQVQAEACPLNLVPTASTTASLALGDALAMTLLEKKGFRKQDFANLHPGGRLGKRLLTVERLMHSGKELPLVPVDASMTNTLQEMTEKRLGMTCVIEADGRLAGVITDGDLRRHLSSNKPVLKETAGSIMSTSPNTIESSALAVQALQLMETHQITALVVTDENRRVEGVVHLHDLWRTELF